jgi:hypothetical protein
VSGFSVEALDRLRSIDEATYETSQNYGAVDTGPWIFRQEGRL